MGQGIVLRCSFSYPNSASVTVLHAPAVTLHHPDGQGRAAPPYRLQVSWVSFLLSPNSRHFSAQKPFPAVVPGTTREPSVSPFSNTPFHRQPCLVSENKIWSSSKGLFQSPMKQGWPSISAIPTTEGQLEIKSWRHRKALYIQHEWKGWKGDLEFLARGTDCFPTPIFTSVAGRCS